jgi:hypothetical protein
MWFHAALATAVMTLAVTLTLLLFAFAAIANGLLLVVERRMHRQ